MYDLIVKGGTVVDPSQSLHGISDVAIEDGKIAKVATDIPAEEAKRGCPSATCLNNRPSLFWRISFLLYSRYNLPSGPASGIFM